VSNLGLTSGGAFLRDAARAFFSDHFENPHMYEEKELHQNLEWTPALRFVVNNHINVFVEPSENGPYPRILTLKHWDVLNFPQPIAIYVVCPESMIVSPSQQADRKRLQAHGFGLVTVDHSGQASRMFPAVPLAQVIPRTEFKEKIRSLPRKIRQRVSEAFDDYQNQPVNGVKAISEILEGLVEQAGKDAVKKSNISRNRLGNRVAEVLDAFYTIGQFATIRAEIGGVRRYIKEYRNMSHHWPKNRQKSCQKYTECRHAFLDGINQLRRFREATKSVGLSGNLPRL